MKLMLRLHCQILNGQPTFTYRYESGNVLFKQQLTVVSQILSMLQQQQTCNGNKPIFSYQYL